MPNIDDPEYITTTEAAKLLGVANITLEMYRSRGKGPAYRKLSRKCVRYRKRDVIAWAENHAVETKDSR